jgi:hypothetical protein
MQWAIIDKAVIGAIVSLPGAVPTGLLNLARDVAFQRALSSAAFGCRSLRSDLVRQRGSESNGNPIWARLSEAPNNIL